MSKRLKLDLFPLLRATKYTGASTTYMVKLLGQQGLTPKQAAGALRGLTMSRTLYYEKGRWHSRGLPTVLRMVHAQLPRTPRWTSWWDIHKATKQTPGAVFTALATLRRHGYAVQAGKGRWSSTEKDPWEGAA